MSYDEQLAVREDLALVPTTLRGVATSTTPLVLDFSWPQYSVARVKGFYVLSGSPDIDDEITAEVGVEIPGIGWYQIQTLTIGALAVPKDGEMDISADYAMKVPRGVIVRVRYATQQASVKVAVTADSWFPAPEVINPPPGA